MKNFRVYGKPPFLTVVVHGGPGIPGDAAPLAKELGMTTGILEPLQMKDSVSGQADELKQVIEENATCPVTLIGHSWGAMLSYIVTAQNPTLVKKLILVSSGVFDERYTPLIMQTRLKRLHPEERRSLQELLTKLSGSEINEKSKLFAAFGRMIEKTDSFRPVPHNSTVIKYEPEIYDSVWNEAVRMRRSGELLSLGKHINCPVLIIHGAFDPHPYDGVVKPLMGVVSDVHSVLLGKCGHYPWLEKEARGEFYRILKNEL